MEEKDRNLRKTLLGTVVSDKMQQTVVIVSSGAFASALQAPTIAPARWCPRCGQQLSHR
jgi:hypothetical protein